MTVFEYFKQIYDQNHAYYVESVNSEIEVDSYKFVKVVWDNFWGGTANVDNYYNISGTTDCKEMFELGYLKRWDDTSWLARQKGTTRHVALTVKGLKAWYKKMM